MSSEIIKKIIQFTFITTTISFSFFNNVLADPEVNLLKALEAIQQSDINKAQLLLKTIINNEPEFKLAHLVYADLLKTRAAPLNHAGMGLGQSDKLDDLLDEVRLRYSANQTSIATNGKIPTVLRKIDNKHQHIITIDLEQSRLYLFENIDGTPKHIADYYISMGRGGGEKRKEGDLKTPLGVYFIQSYIPPNKLSDKYGAGAFPINYPNELDRYNRLTGSGIWLHGTRSGTYNRAPLASEGCVVLPNENLIKLKPFITLGKTPVIIGNNLEWQSVEEWSKSSKKTASIFNNWVNSWESLDVDKYLSHYSKKFNNGQKTYPLWASHKRRVAKHKKYIQVNATNISHLKHPNKDIMVTTFKQNYVSNNYSRQSWKRQYWKKESDGVWRIIFENNINWPSATQYAIQNN